MEGIPISVDSNRDFILIERGYGKFYVLMEGEGMSVDGRNICTWKEYLSKWNLIERGYGKDYI